MRILCLLTDGFEELEAIGTIALLRRAGIQVDIYALEHSQATGRFDITITTLHNSDELHLQDYDALFLPGGPHYQKLSQSNLVIEAIDYFYTNQKIIAAICAAPTILGKLGYLKNKHYTCFCSMNEDFQGIYHNTHVMIDHNIITGRSAASTIHFAFALIEAIGGKELAQTVKDAIYYENS